jgi:hypothetical protein
MHHLPGLIVLNVPVIHHMFACDTCFTIEIIRLKEFVMII